LKQPLFLALYIITQIFSWSILLTLAAFIIKRVKLIFAAHFEKMVTAVDGSDCLQLIA
jgi:hypothetical protein